MTSLQTEKELVCLFSIGRSIESCMPRLMASCKSHETSGQLLNILCCLNVQYCKHQSKKICVRCLGIVSGVKGLNGTFLASYLLAFALLSVLSCSLKLKPALFKRYVCRQKNFGWRPSGGHSHRPIALGPFPLLAVSACFLVSLRLKYSPPFFHALFWVSFTAYSGVLLTRKT